MIWSTQSDLDEIRDLLARNDNVYPTYAENFGEKSAVSSVNEAEEWEKGSESKIWWFLQESSVDEDDKEHDPGTQEYVTNLQNGTKKFQQKSAVRATNSSISCGRSY